MVFSLPLNIPRAVDFFFGILLLLAAMLKAGVLPGEVFFNPSATMLQAGWLIAAVVSFEAMLAAWLMSKLASNAARRIAVVTIMLFIGIETWRLLRGDASCGCFGALQVPPVVTLSLNAVCLFTYCVTDALNYRVRGSSGGRERDGPRTVSLLLTVFVVPVTLAATAFFVTGGS